jgi:hypothetical protein
MSVSKEIGKQCGRLRTGERDGMGTTVCAGNAEKKALFMWLILQVLDIANALLFALLTVTIVRITLLLLNIFPSLLWEINELI